jgi:UDP:flavonoid glycosyltransferase YjiC (YdhE family)
MTRILCATNPMSGHVRPMLAIAGELAGAGHDVLWCTTREFEPLITNTGARFTAIGDRVDFDAALRRAAGRPGVAGLNRAVLEFFIKPIPLYVSDLIPVFDEFRPDVVVADSSFRAGIFLAEKRGIGRVAVSNGPLNLSSADTPPFGFGLRPSASPLSRLRNRVLSWAARAVIFREAQRTARQIRSEMHLRPLDGYFIDWVAQVADRYLQGGLPDYEYPRRDLPESVRFVGPLLLEEHAGQWARPAWWPELASARSGGRPVIFITQGTVATDPSGLIRPAVRGLADSGALLVVTTGGRDPDEVLPARHRPASTRITGYIPYAEVLPLTDVMVTNGGFGGAVAALAHGVPLVVIGNSEDKREVGERVAWSGAGIALSTSRPRPGRVRRAVQEVLSAPAYRTRAAQIATAHDDYRGAADAAAAILEVARTVSPAP